jgi:apolipoprotein N-acyltransferase
MRAKDDYSLLSPAGRRWSLTRNVSLAILSGVMLTASFPPLRLSFLAFFALVPLLISIKNEPFSKAFKLGFIAGTTHYLTLIYWIVVVLSRYGNLSTLVSLGPFVLLCLYLGLYLAFFSGIAAWLMGSRFFLLSIASVWVGLEYVRAKLLTGFPWCLLGYTQYGHLHLIQIADLCGVYGISFLIILSNGLLYHLFFSRHDKIKGALRWEILSVLLLISGTYAYGHFCLKAGMVDKGPLRMVNAVVVQANIDQSLKWEPNYQTETIETYQRLTRAAYDLKPDLIVWPETSVPFFFQNDVKFAPKILSLVRESNSSILFGSPAYKRIHGKTKYYNRAYLITSADQPPQYYDKVKLVPFGEYVPLKRYLFFVSRLVPAAGDFEPGNRITPLKGKYFLPGILICFEAIFPELASTQTREGANILINLTNDAWFGKTSAPYQHLSMAVFRAVENRRPMIRAANTGFSAFIGPEGKIIELSSLFEEEVLKASIGISNSPLTFYARFGDLFAFSLLAISLIRILSRLWYNWIVRR